MVESRLSSEELAAIAEEAYVFSFPMLMGYRACFGAFLVPSLPSYSGPMNELHGDPVTLDHNYKVSLHPTRTRRTHQQGWTSEPNPSC